MDAASRSIIGYRASSNRSVGPCVLAMRMAFNHIKSIIPKGFHFIADGYSAYPLAAQQFLEHFGDKMKFKITQVLGLTNDDAVTTEFRPYNQVFHSLFDTTAKMQAGFPTWNISLRDFFLLMLTGYMSDTGTACRSYMTHMKYQDSNVFHRHRYIL